MLLPHCVYGIVPLGDFMFTHVNTYTHIYTCAHPTPFFSSKGWQLCSNQHCWLADVAIVKPSSQSLQTITNHCLHWAGASSFTAAASSFQVKLPAVSTIQTWIVCSLRCILLWRCFLLSVEWRMLALQPQQWKINMKPVEIAPCEQDL